VLKSCCCISGIATAVLDSNPALVRLLDRCAEIHYTFGDFADALIVYTPSLSLPLFEREGTPPQGK
jgi:hypothetical protein